MTWYMKMDGATGSSTFKGHEGWTQLREVGWNGGSGQYWAFGEEDLRGENHAYLSEVRVEKIYDKASGPLVTNLLKKVQAKTVTIHKVDAQDVVTQQYVLSDVFVSSYEYVAVGNGDADTENFTLNCAKFAYKATSLTEQASGGGTATVTYDFSDGSASS